MPKDQLFPSRGEQQSPVIEAVAVPSLKKSLAHCWPPFPGEEQRRRDERLRHTRE